MSGSLTFYASALYNMAEGAFNLLTGKYQVVLLTASYSPDTAINSTYANISADETSGTGYTAGGQALTGQTLYYTAGSATIGAGGTGFAASSTFDVTVSGGTATTPAVLSVTTNASGVITTIDSVVTEGNYSALPANPVTVTGGTGTGATLDITWQATVGANAASWPNSTISAQYAAIVSMAGSSLASTDKLLCFVNLNPGGAPISSTNGTFSVSFPTGLVNL
jgi:hypothetical protein